jgi:hypothetical protein
MRQKAFVRNREAISSPVLDQEFGKCEWRVKVFNNSVEKRVEKTAPTIKTPRESVG